MIDRDPEPGQQILVNWDPELPLHKPHDLWIYVPEDYETNAPKEGWPIIYNFPDFDTSVLDPAYVAKHGLAKKIEEGFHLPFIVVTIVPVATMRVYRRNSDVARIIGLLDQLFNMNNKQIYATGWGTGANYAYQAAVRHRHMLAAIIPVASNPVKMPRHRFAGLSQLDDIPMWVFHGHDDKSDKEFVDSEIAEVRAITKHEVKLTWNSDTSKATMDAAYDEPGLWEWILSKKSHALHFSDSSWRGPPRHEEL